MRKKTREIKEGVVLARVGAATINIAEDNKLYVVWRGHAAFVSSGAKGAVYFDREDFHPPAAVVAEVVRLLGVQRTNRIKNWHRRSPDHYDEQELQLVTLYR